MHKWIKLFVSTLFLASLAIFQGGCAAPGDRLHTDIVPEGSLRLGQVVYLATRDQVVDKPNYKSLLASGIKDSEITDGSLVLARMYCCGGITADKSPEKSEARVLYVPNGIKVSKGDVVEYLVGREHKKDDPGQPNQVIRVVQKQGSSEQNCWWDPKDDRLWLRTLYCDWMPKEGWIKQGGGSPAWYKPAAK